MAPETPQRMMAAAQCATGLADWGGPGYFEAEFRRLFTAMSHSLEHEAHLHAAGRHGAELRLQGMLESRLRFIADRRASPEIAQERIVRPIVILGLPRSGSTFLHGLLAQDPANRVPLAWEMMFPAPVPDGPGRPREPHGRRDPRIHRAAQILTAMGAMAPALRALHPFGAEEPEECHLMMEQAALGDNLPAFWRMPAYNQVRAQIDPAIGYRFHRLVLQSLQYRQRGERIVLKNPGHLFHLESLLATYPDACIVQTHRDPAKVIPSVAALLVAMRRANSDDAPPPERIASGNLRAFAAGVARAIEFRRHSPHRDQFEDVIFTQLVADPIGTVRRLYQRFRIPLPEAAVGAMQAWLADPAKRPPKGRHRLADYGLDAATIDAQFGPYLDHHAIPRERASLA